MNKMVLHGLAQTTSRSEFIRQLLFALLLLALPVTMAISAGTASRHLHSEAGLVSSSQSQADSATTAPVYARESLIRKQMLAAVGQPVNYGFLILVALLLHSPILIGICLGVLMLRKSAPEDARCEGDKSSPSIQIITRNAASTEGILHIG